MLYFIPLSWMLYLGCDGDATPPTNPLPDQGMRYDLDQLNDLGKPADMKEQGVTLGLNPSYFLADGLKSPIEEVSCTLTDGTSTMCYRIVIAGAPADHEVGPFCPRTLDEDPTKVGMWMEGGEVWNLDGDFIQGLSTFYNDDNWLLYDPQSRAVNVTTTKEACEAAARPNVDPMYQNHCVECELSYVDGGINQTYLIPKTPIAASANGAFGRTAVGVALNGVQLDPPAPVQAILGAYTIAAFDDCGGHINPFEGYHYHAATGCSKQIEQDDSHAPLLGYAMDGYGLYAHLNEDNVAATDLDTCGGHTDDKRGYHYHVAKAGENKFISCFHGLLARN